MTHEFCKYHDIFKNIGKKYEILQIKEIFYVIFSHQIFQIPCLRPLKCSGSMLKGQFREFLRSACNAENSRTEQCWCKYCGNIGPNVVTTIICRYSEKSMQLNVNIHTILWDGCISTKFSVLWQSCHNIIQCYCANIGAKHRNPAKL